MLRYFYPVIIVLVLQNVYITTAWSAGTYALLEPKTGCPNEWQEEGQIQQITGANNEHSKVLHILGEVKRGTVSRYFCIKKINYYRKYRSWPTGQYCIHGRRNIRLYGYLKIFEPLTNTDWSRLINLNPFAFFKKDARNNWFVAMYFVCQTSGNKKIPISLPITKPFYLLPYGSRDCQQVQWMAATSEWIKYHTNNYKYYKYGNKYGKAPYHELGNFTNKGITMFYCYYESCNNTLNDTSGVFQSPGFPGQYPDGQLCSWKIKVPDNHTVQVRFAIFSLYQYDKDCLQLYENENGGFKPRQAFFGHQKPFNITAKNEIMFVFRSDEENNSNGFQAEYEVLKIPERTTTKPPLTTTPPPTTTTQPTTKLTTNQPTTTLPTNKPITTEETIFQPTATNSTTNKTLQCDPTSTKYKSYDKHSNIHPLREKTCFCDETWRIVVMVIPLAVLIVLVSIDIFCRCRSKEEIKNGADGSSANDEMVVNPVYERGNIILDQPTDSVTVASTVNTTDDQPQSRDELPDYEDVDYTQLNDIPPPRRLSKRQECYALEPVGADNSAVFYHVLEPSLTEPNGTQSHSTERVCAGAPDVFYHTLEHPTDLNPPAYQNLSEVNQYTMNPLYEASDNSPPLVEANRLYDNYMA